MHIPTPVTGLNHITLRDLNVQINNMISDINTGNASPQDLIGRLHVLAVFLQPLDAELQELRTRIYEEVTVQSLKERLDRASDELEEASGIRPVGGKSLLERAHAAE